MCVFLEFQNDVSKTFNLVHFLLVFKIDHFPFLFLKFVVAQGNIDVKDGWKQRRGDEKESIKKGRSFEKQFPVGESEKTCGYDRQNEKGQEGVQEIHLSV